MVFLTALALALSFQTIAQEKLSFNFSENQKFLSARDKKYGKKIPSPYTIEQALETKGGVEYSFYLRCDYPTGKVRYLKCKTELYDPENLHIYLRYSDQNEKPYIVIFAYDKSCLYPNCDSLPVATFPNDPRFDEIYLKKEKLTDTRWIYYRITDILPWEMKLAFQEFFSEK